MSINSNYNSNTVGQFVSNDPPASSRPNLKSAFDALGSALQSGDLSGGQQAFAQIQNAHKGHGHHRHSDGDKQGQTSGPGADFKALSDALSANNLQAAQQAWTKLQNDRKSFGPQQTQQAAEPAPYTATDSGLNVSA